MDLIKGPNEIKTATAVLAKQLGIKQWKECSAAEQRIKEAIDIILQTAIEPIKGLTEDGVEFIKTHKGESDFWSLNNNLPWIAFVALIGAGLSAFMFHKGINPLKLLSKQK